MTDLHNSGIGEFLVILAIYWRVGYMKKLTCREQASDTKIIILTLYQMGA